MTASLVGNGPHGGVTWVDVVEPSSADLDQVAARYGLHKSSVRDCLDPDHLPKWERFQSHLFLILRVYDVESERECATIREMTRKVAIFAGPDFVVTIHRKPLPFLEQLKAKWQDGAAPLGNGAPEPLRLVYQIVHEGLETYAAPLESSEEGLDAFEEALFERREGQGDLMDLYRLRRRVMLMKRMLWRTLEVIKGIASPEALSSTHQDLREHAESLHFYSDEIADNAGALMNLYFAMASQRTNNVMRVLTVFSAFFLPLTFIVGIYGMNFDWMPELRWRWGYPAIWGVMLTVTLGIFLWFRRRGWLQR